MRVGPRTHLASLLVLATAWATAACDSAKSGTGVSLGEDGKIVVDVRPCESNELVYDVRLEDNSVSKGGSIAWEIATDGGSAMRTFVVGTTPPGFTEVVPLASDAATMSDVTVVVRRTFDDHDGNSFDPHGLSTNEILVDGNQVSPAEFASRDVCN